MRTLSITPRRGWPLSLQAAIVVLACAAIYWTGLGSSGFNQSEGFRVFPAYEMLDSGDWALPRLFGQAYLRKPPGVPWVIAIASEVLGRNEWAARAPAALASTLSCLLTLWCAARWFGSRHALWAALAHALTPLFWYAGRSAEIEAINNLCTQIVIVAIIEALRAMHLRPDADATARTTSPSPALWIFAALTLGMSGFLFAKGPASLPCLGGALLAIVPLMPLMPRSRGAFARSSPASSGGGGRVFEAGGGESAPISPVIRTTRDAHPRSRWRALVPVALAALLAGALFAWWAWLANERARGLDPVTQTPERFLWDIRRVHEILLLLPRTIASALPWGLVVLLPLATETTRGRRVTVEDSLARALAATTLFALAIYTLAGIHNVRYAMPAMATCFPLVAWFWTRNEGARRSLAIAPAGAARVRIGIVLILAAFAGVWLPMEEARRARNSGLHAGRALAEVLPNGAFVQGDLLIDTRPEVLHYAAIRARELGKSITYRWKPDRGDLPLPPAGGFFILRTDDQDEFNKERARYAAAGKIEGVPIVYDGVIQRGKFAFRVLGPMP